MTEKNAKIYIAGHNGMVGSALLRVLKKKGYNNLLCKNKSELNLLNQNEVFSFLKKEKPSYIFIAAARVGGIQINNSQRADFLYENLMIEANLIHGAHLANIQKLCFLGSSCIYPKYCDQPIKEEYLLTGSLEHTNEPYAVAKIAGIKLCESYNTQYGREYISVMPTNLYGPNDNFDLKTSHVLPAILRKSHEAFLFKKNLEIWGSGRSKREFLYVDDLAEACLFLMELNQFVPLINIGFGEDIEIIDLVEIINKITGFDGRVVFDLTKPDGTPRKLLDSSKIRNLGWKPKVSLKEGISFTYSNFVKNVSS
jgi:GDP-L-fucose synthase